MPRMFQWIVPAVVACAAIASQGVCAELSLQPDSRLPEAVKRGDLAEVESLLHEHVPVNSAEGDGSTALHWAAYENNLPVARLLLEAHANVNAQTRDESLTPLFMACQNGSAPMIELLLKHGADANGVNTLGTSPLMVAAASGSVDAVKVLIDHGANVNSGEYVHNQTPLMFAANLNRGDVIRFLIAHGANPNVESKVVVPYRLPFHGLANTVKPKQTAAGSEAKNDASGTGKADAAGGDEDSDDDADKPKESATAADKSKAADIEAIKKMFRERGPKTTGGMSPLLYAARQGNIEAALALLNGGANINEASGSEQTTPLVMAIANGHLDFAKVLLEHGADPNLANEEGLTPLYATIDVKWVPREWSPEPLVGQEKTDYLQLMQLLIAHGADVNARLRKVIWERVLTENQTWIDPAGSTAFLRAAQADDLKAMKLLKDAGADPNIHTYAGVTPLMVAAGLGWGANYSTTAPNRLEAVKYCVSLGGKVSQADGLGYTALHGAAFVGDLDVIRYLIGLGASLTVKTNAGDTVADSANGLFEKSIPQPEAVALLVQLGAPVPHNCRSSECLPNVDAKVRH
jgi:uncharacterized protein